jgi:hypothetical protein
LGLIPIKQKLATMGKSDSSSLERKAEEEVTKVEISILSRTGKKIYSDKAALARFSAGFMEILREENKDE